MKRTVLPLCHTPRFLGGVEEYYASFRGCRKPTDLEVANLGERHEAILTLSSLVQVRASFGSRIQNNLESGDSKPSVYLGSQRCDSNGSDILDCLDLLVLVRHFA